MEDPRSDVGYAMAGFLKWTDAACATFRLDLHTVAQFGPAKICSWQPRNRPW